MAGLFFLFFIEMFERFSFYGMRIVLVLFLTAPILSDNPRWDWPRENALALIGTYASLLYLTPIIGGFSADKTNEFQYNTATVRATATGEFKLGKPRQKTIQTTAAAS